MENGEGKKIFEIGPKSKEKKSEKNQKENMNRWRPLFAKFMKEGKVIWVERKVTEEFGAGSIEKTYNEVVDSLNEEGVKLYDASMIKNGKTSGYRKTILWDEIIDAGEDKGATENNESKLQVAKETTEPEE